MPTGTELKETKDFLKNQGEMVELIGKDRQRRTWYRPDGVAIPNQPFDGYTIARNRAKGWTLTPPTNPVPAAATAQEPPKPAEAALALPKPPKHIHVMEAAMGSPCLVRGCGHVRREPKGRWQK